MTDGSALQVGRLYAGGTDSASAIVRSNQTPEILEVLSDGRIRAKKPGGRNARLLRNH